MSNRHGHGNGNGNEHPKAHMIEARDVLVNFGADLEVIHEGNEKHLSRMHQIRFLVDEEGELHLCLRKAHKKALPMVFEKPGRQKRMVVGRQYHVPKGGQSRILVKGSTTALTIEHQLRTDHWIPNLPDAHHCINESNTHYLLKLTHKTLAAPASGLEFDRPLRIVAIPATARLVLVD